MSDLAARIWARDTGVWSSDPATPEIADRLGWLDAPEGVVPEAPAGGARRLVLCGMGGSSLAPAVLWRAFGRIPAHPTFRLLDSTHPAALPGLSETDCVLIASKSGTTIETACLEAWAAETVPPERMIAITDPGTPLATRPYHAVYLNAADIGGRYSALSLFGMVPAALLGLNVPALLARGRDAARECRRPDNAWERLGRALAQAALRGRDKLTLFTSPSLAAFGLWLEQLIAESTGKAGKGIVPVIGEPPGEAAVYGDDRVFVTVTLAGEIAPFPPAGHPVHAVTLADREDLGAQFFGWSFATAVMGHVLGVHPFNQPDVADAKRRTQEALAAGREGGKAEARAVRALIDGTRPGAYLAILAYVPPGADRRLAALAARLRARTGAAVTVGYGPRYLHSTGQLHKGGPATGRFLLVGPEILHDVPVPGRDFTFGRLCAAQADGDVQALEARGRPVARVPSLEALEQLL